MNTNIQPLPGYRLLEPHERPDRKLGDQFRDPDFPIEGWRLTDGDGTRVTNGRFVYQRPVKLDPVWISYDERQPTAADGNGKGVVALAVVTKLSSAASTIDYKWKPTSPSAQYYWLPLSNMPPPPAYKPTQEDVDEEAYNTWNKHTGLPSPHQAFLAGVKYARENPVSK